MGKCKICGKYTYGKYKYCIDCYYSLDENEKEFNEEYNKTIDINQKYPPTHRT